MTPAIALMISAYILVRCVEIIAAARHGLVLRLMAVITIAITVMAVGDVLVAANTATRFSEGVAKGGVVLRPLRQEVQRI
jgi:hypothetical protein